MKNIVMGTLVVLFLMAAFAFYWFAYKSMTARVACAKIAQDIRYIKEQESKNKIDIHTLTTVMENEYNFCLHSKGL
jgi:uncharacterized protein YxeA